MAEIELAGEGSLCMLMTALISETIEGLRDEFLKWKEAIESKGLKVNNWKTKAMVSIRITKDGLSKSELDQCGICSLRVKANSTLRQQCGRCIHGRCIHGRHAGVKRVT